jgi:hypothetical protein
MSYMVSGNDFGKREHAQNIEKVKSLKSYLDGDFRS